jgi:hypothetical protein
VGLRGLAEHAPEAGRERAHAAEPNRDADVRN